MCMPHCEMNNIYMENLIDQLVIQGKEHLFRGYTNLHPFSGVAGGDFAVNDAAEGSERR